MPQFKRGHNRLLNALLTKVRRIAENAKTEDDFGRIFVLLRQFAAEQGLIRYNHAPKYWFMAIMGLIIGATGLLIYLFPEHRIVADGYGYILIGAAAVPLIVLLAWAGGQSCKISGISDLIFKKDMYFDNELKAVPVPKGTYKGLHAAFGDFRDRGEEDRYIEQMGEGNHRSEIFPFPYRYYTFHYVEVYYVLVTRKIGNSTYVTTERRTRTCYRYGLLLDFPYAKRLAVVSSGGRYDYAGEWEPTSHEFSSRFNVHCDEQIAASRFLKPSVVREFVGMAGIGGLNVEINGVGQMCVSFSDSDVLLMARGYSIAEPDAFEKEIMGMLRPPKLNRLLRFIEVLKKHNDSNF